MAELFERKVSLLQLPISCFIYEPVMEDGGVVDFRIVYTNNAFMREWAYIGTEELCVGSLLRKNSLMDEYSLQMMQRFLSEQPHSFVTHHAGLNLYLHMEPMTDLPEPYGGFFVTNITDYENREENNRLVREMLLSKILVRQFDMVAYIQKGAYGVTIGDKARITEGSIFPNTRYGLYDQYLAEQVIPVLNGTDEACAAMRHALSLPEIKREVAIQEPYVVNITIRIDGKDYHKRFNFYEGDAKQEFYIVLKSDTTELFQEQKERNEQMAAALREAKEANTAKSSFLSSMSHEIRTPMNAIIGLGKIAMQDPELSDRTRNYLNKINISAKHMLGLINDILNMSRIESGRMVINNEEFSMSDFLEQINTLISSQCQDKGLCYDSGVIGALSDFYIGDDMKLKQVLINILGNAVKFTPEGGTVFFKTEQTSVLDDHAMLRFVVRDTGIGMDKEYLPKLFDAFTQEDGTTTNRYGGSGLGMAITRNIVELMNGTIAVTSEKGKGSEFTVTIPLHISERKLQDREKETLFPSNFHVLVIDDNPIDLGHMQVTFNEVGIASEVSSDVEKSLEMLRIAKARGNAFNVILLDYVMPDTDGIQLARRIRELDTDVPIILLTAHSVAEFEDEAIASGIDMLVAKPVMEPDVMPLLRKALTRKQNKAGDSSLRDLTGKHILLAEDIEINAEIVTELLSMQGLETDVAENGRIAVNRFTESEPGYYSAVLMDLRMPVLDGLGATKEIRESGHPDSAGIPIIALTANAFDEDVQSALQAGMNAFLSKPIEPEKLFEILGKLIS
ncbi:MAG: response regulator [Oscillospiraceae bacterium]|nr:response regulator [Oscillospiraceae bacterium]